MTNGLLKRCISWRHVMLLLLAVISLASCGSEQVNYGQITADSTSSVSYENDIKPIFESRCIACHSCYDAPCQLKLSSYDGVQRGGSDTRVYEPTRLREAPLTRLHFDALSTDEWRTKGFHSVLKKESLTQTEKGEFSTLLGMLDLKRARTELAAPKQDKERNWHCSANQSEFSEFVSDYPNYGMPFRFPPLSTDQHTAIANWIASGTKNDSIAELSKPEAAQIDRWEAWLNGDSLKHQLVARYIYEHLFLAHLYFDKTTTSKEPTRFFQLVRSTTPPGTPIEVIATRRPYDDPMTERPFYRFRLYQETPVAKTHMPYKLDMVKADLWQQWFFEREYDVTSLPGYDIATASNPFKTFSALPAKSRYQFMLSESHFTVGGFIKGPVCKGQSAVNVISEQFWVFFLDPDVQAGEEIMAYLGQTKALLDLPAEKEDTLRLFSSWNQYADREKDFLRLRREYMQEHMLIDGQMPVELIWDGEGHNQNASLTVFRHFDHASVRKGLIGELPKTVWVIDYPLLERIHYLLVAGYDVYGNISHQLLSRIYMDFLRMEGESLFLSFLDKYDRSNLRNYWYRDADKRIEKFMVLTDIDLPAGSVIVDSKNPKQELVRLFKNRLGKSLSARYQIGDALNQSMIESIMELHKLKSKGFFHLPDTSLIEVVDGEERQFFTLIKNVGHQNNSSILMEGFNLIEKETSVSLVRGFIAPRPNMFYSLNTNEFESWLARLVNIKSKQDYRALVEDYGIPHSDQRFWSIYDRFNHGYRLSDPEFAAWLDLNSYE